jgi:Carboxypeptidase regulatory-like domain/TonB dependent receptor
MSRPIRFIQLALFTLIIFGLDAIAQTNRGSITGSILDRTGAVVPKAKVTARNNATSVTIETESTGDGAYRLQQLPAGVYTLRATAGGFKAAEVTSVIVEVNSTTARDIVLDTGEVTETVTITAEGALTIQSQTSDVGTVVTSKQVLELPLLVGAGGGFGLRSPEAFTFLTPGVVGPGTGTDNGINNDNAGENGGTFNSKFAGSQNFSNEVLVEGASTFRSENGSSFDETAPSVEAFQEFKVMTSSLSAEYGRTGGGITSFAFKSGTNLIHGSVYDYFRNRVLSANRFFNNARGREPVTGREIAPRPFDNFNDYGATVGGPIFLPRFGEGGKVFYDGRNRSFFFFIYEGSQRKIGGSSISTLPIDDFRGGNFSSLITSTTPIGTDALGRSVLGGQIFDPATTRLVTAGQIDPITGLMATSTGVVRDPLPGNRIPEARFSSVARNVLRFIPNANQPGRFENFIFNGTSPLDVYTFALKLDHAITGTSRLSGSYSKRVNDRVVGVRVLPDLVNRGNQDQLFTTHYFRLTHDQTFSPRLLNHFNFGVNRTESLNQSPTVNEGIPGQIGLLGVENTHFPEFNFGGGIVGIGYGLSANNFDTGLRLNDYLSVISGSHNLRFGGEFRHQRYTPTNQNNLAGTFNFGSGQTAALANNQTIGGSGFGFASFLLGQTQSGNLNFAPSVPQWRTSYYAAFLQDDWKVTKNLTLNLGLRYDVDTPRYELYDRYSSFDPTAINPGAGGRPGAMIFAGEGPGLSGTRTFADTYKRAFGPRVGFAYSPDFEGFLGKLLGGGGKTVFRGGYGVYYQALQYADFGERMQAGFKATPGFNSANGFDPAFLLDQGFPQNFPRPPFIDPTVRNNPSSPQEIEFVSREHARPAMIQNYGLEIQRELARDLILNLGYMGVQGHRLRSNLVRYNTLRNENLQLGNLLFANINSPEARAAGIFPPFAGFQGNVAQALRPFPQYGTILTDCCLENAGNSNYNAAYVKIERRFSKGLNLLASYTFSKAMTNADSALPIFATFSGGGEVQNPYDLKSEKAVSNQDIPHALVLSYIYELPFGEGRAFKTGNGFIDKLIGGFQIGAVHRYQSGQPLSFCCSGGIPTYGRIRPGLVPGQEILSEAVRNGTFDPGSPIPAQREYFNRAAFYDVNAICLRDSAGNFVRNSPFGCRLPTEPLRFSSMPRTLSDLRSERFFNEDINILKKTRIHEEVMLEFRTEVFNLFNRVVFRRPNTFDVFAAGSNFGRVFGQSNTPRVIQFGLKLIF